VSGEIRRGDVIARHTLHIADARVLTQTVQGRFREIPAGTALARVQTDKRVLWCDLRENRKWMSRGLFDCLTDSRGDGRLDQTWTGLTPYYFAASGAAVVRDPRTLAEIAPGYRPARPEERPVIKLGYQWCDGDGAAKPARFVHVLRTAEDDDWSAGLLGGCKAGQTIPADGKPATFDDLSITLSPGGESGVLRYAVSGRLKPIADLAPVAPAPGLYTRDSQAAKAAEAAAADAAARAANAELKPLIVEGLAPTLAQGTLTKGQPLLTVAVRHGVTGVLKHDLSGKGQFFDQPLVTGQPVYALPMDAGLVWCAPRQGQKPLSKETTLWSSACFRETGAPQWTRAQTAMMSLQLDWSRARKLGGEALVERGPAGLPPMTLSYVFAGWSDQGSLQLEVRLDWGEGPQLLRSLRIAPGADGAAPLKVLGGLMAVRRTGDNAEVSTTAPPRLDAELVY
jgi:hypothetical protein